MCIFVAWWWSSRIETQILLNAGECYSVNISIWIYVHGCCIETAQNNLFSLWSVPTFVLANIFHLQIFWSKCCVHFWSELCQVTNVLTALHIVVPWWVLKDRLMLFRIFGTVPHILYILLSMDAYQNKQRFLYFSSTIK